MTRSSSLLILAVFFCAVQISRADIVTTISGTIIVDDGPDLLGLNGASYELSARFADNTTWNNLGSFPAVVSMSHSMTIQGSTSGDGTFTDDDGFAWLSTNSGLFYSAGASFNAWRASQSPGIGTYDKVSNWATGPVSPQSGNPLAEENFAQVDSAFLFANRIFGGQRTNYGLVGGGSFSFTIVAIPEPSTGLLLLAGFGLLSARRTRRRRDY